MIIIITTIIMTIESGNGSSSVKKAKTKHK